MSPKHLQRYVDEFVGRHNCWPFDTESQMASVARGMVGKRLTYAALTQGPRRLLPATPPRRRYKVGNIFSRRSL